MFTDPIERATKLFPEYKWALAQPIFSAEFDSDDEVSIVSTADGQYMCRVYRKTGRLYTFVEIGEEHI